MESQPQSQPEESSDTLAMDSLLKGMGEGYCILSIYRNLTTVHRVFIVESESIITEYPIVSESSLSVSYLKVNEPSLKSLILLIHCHLT